MNATYLIYFCGLFNISFAIFHLFFWKIFNWGTGLKNLSKANSAIIQILNIQLIFSFVASAIVCFFMPKELLNTNLGKGFLIFWFMFWALRLVQQFIFLKINHRLVHFLSFAFFMGMLLFGYSIYLAYNF